VSPFGHLHVQLDPWDVDYGAELSVDNADATPEDSIELDVEQPAGEWRPIVPVRTDLRELVFVDGVRRIEARLVIRDNDKIVSGALGSYGVGSVIANAHGANWGTIVVGRVAACGGGLLLPQPLRVAPLAEYQPFSTADTAADGPSHAVHNEMRRCEARIAQAFAAEGRLVVVDGPLTFDAPERGRAIGYIKSLHRLYLPPGYLDLLRALPAGGRTPMFALRSSQKVIRYSWFLRLAAPSPGESDLSGLVRLEVAHEAGVEEARTLADSTAANLPRYAPHRGRDPRAPQNLLPVGALEARLRHALGDQRMARRHIQSFIARESIHA
jgi:hypothetical protein